MLSAVLNHYARYQQKRKHGETCEPVSTSADLDSIYRSSINGSGIEFLVKDPICRGFLLGFCEECFNAENMLFLIEVEKYRESLKNDRSLWSKTWQEIDANLSVDPDKVYEWHSRVSVESVKAHIKYIYETYISDGAEHQICVPHGVLQRTLKRMENVEAYGLVLFHEISVDPMRTLERDILPRFVHSEKYRKLCDKLDLLTHLPSGEELIVEAPPTEPNLSVGVEANKLFTMDDILASRFLYEHFLTYVQGKVCSENLVCKRLITIFKENIRANRTDAADVNAWDIYRFFVAAGSAYEVSLEYSAKSQLKTNLAHPLADMFDALERSVTSMLGADFEAYRTTAEYRQLAPLLKDHIRALKREYSVKKSEKKNVGCLG